LSEEDEICRMVKIYIIDKGVRSIRNEATGRSVIVIKLKNDMSEIGRMAEELERYCDEGDLPPKTGLDLNLVLEELVTNIISYGYEDEEEHLITIDIDRDGDILEVEVIDDGIAFNPLEAPPPLMSDNIDELEPGGLGIHLVKKLTDEASYRRKDERNILTIKKIIPTA
jgi:serine/threonine-protein kinase RsbW